VTDYAVFAYLCDLFVDSAHQGHGLGKWLVRSIVAAPELVTVRRILLVTRDAHELYRRYGGFELLSPPADWLARINLEH
jgi:GNAT superfamily N-acetyltransferase